MHAYVTNLLPDDCFIYTPASGMDKVISEIDRVNQLRSDLDIPRIEDLSYQQLLGWQQMFGEPHIVENTVLATGDRISVRLTDGKRFVWYADNPEMVRFEQDRAVFDKLLAELKQSLKMHNEEIAKLTKQRKKRSKKTNKPEELVERTEVLAR